METLDFETMVKKEELLIEKLNLEYQLKRLNDAVKRIFDNPEATKPLLTSMREYRMRIEEIDVLLNKM